MEPLQARAPGRDARGRPLSELSPEEYAGWCQSQREIVQLQAESLRFRAGRKEGKTGTGSTLDGGGVRIWQQEIQRRQRLGKLRGRAMGVYEGDPVWDDVVPIPQEEGEGALAAIAYSDEYAEGQSGLGIPRIIYS